MGSRGGESRLLEMDWEWLVSPGSVGTGVLFISGGNWGPGEPLLCPRGGLCWWALTLGVVGGFSVCSLLPSFTGWQQDSGSALERACVGSLGEFSPPHYIRFRDGEASAYLVVRDAVC